MSSESTSLTTLLKSQVDNISIELMNEFPNKLYTKSRINRLLMKFGESTDSQVAVDHEVPALKKMLTWLTIWFWVKNTNFDSQLRCYEITTISLVAAFYWIGTQYNTKMHQIWTFNFIELVRQHILRVVSTVTNCFVGNLTDFPAVKEFWKSVKFWRNYRNKRVARFEIEKRVNRSTVRHKHKILVNWIHAISCFLSFLWLTE